MSSDDDELKPYQFHYIGSTRRVGLYTAALLLTPFLFIAATLYWMSTATYISHAQYPSMHGIGYGLRLVHADCDVVIDGDSTALVGIIPSILQQSTGLKTCNLAETAGVKAVDGNLVLDTYLQHNRPPRYILFQFAPENLTNPRGWDTISLFEGVLLRMQSHPGRQWLRYAVSNPDDFLTSVELAFRTGAHWIFSRPLPPSQTTLREQNSGWFPDEGAPMADCPNSVILREPDHAWLASLREKYSANGTHVLIDVAPEPACAPDRSFYAPRLSNGVTDNTLTSLPLQDFSDSGRLHTTREGAVATSAAIAQQLAAVIRGAR
jgi:hypothetical protein